MKITSILICVVYITGDERKGVTLSRHADVQHELAENSKLDSYYIIIFKVFFKVLLTLLE